MFNNNKDIKITKKKENFLNKNLIWKNEKKSELSFITPNSPFKFKEVDGTQCISL